MISVDDSGCDADNLCWSGAVTVTATADEDWPALVELATRSGWSGVSALAARPGTVGEAVVHNLTAYGQQVADVVASVRTWDLATDRQRTFAAADCGFAPGRSRFLQEPGRYDVRQVDLLFRSATLTPPVTDDGLLELLGVGRGARVPLTEVRAAVLSSRPGGTGPGGGRGPGGHLAPLAPRASAQGRPDHRPEDEEQQSDVAHGVQAVADLRRPPTQEDDDRHAAGEQERGGPEVDRPDQPRGR